ncbi:MAG: hypoxanthine phosphoribosyltransferase [Oscillospiraceae bacterium]
MKNDIKEIIISEATISNKIAELGRKISIDYTGKKLLLVGVLKGCLMFMSDLMRAIEVPLEIDFLTVSSYGSDVVSREVKLINDLRVDVSEYDVLFVEDILDSGKTLKFLKDTMEKRGAKSIKVCTLLDKPERRTAEIVADYKGFVIPDEFVVGYGLDFDEKYRNLKYIGSLKPELYAHLFQ